MTIKISSAQLQERFEKLKAGGDLTVHMKSGRFLSRFAKPSELILTIVAGKLETIHVGQLGDVVVQNIQIGSSAERYVMEAKAFNKRYEKTGNVFDLDGCLWSEVEAIGIIEAIKVIYPVSYWTDTGDKGFIISAPWGEDMLVQTGDWIARPVLADLSVPDPADIYRIEGNTFDQTYAPFEGEAAQRRLARFNAQRPS
jgi:hypothetical protein